MNDEVLKELVPRLSELVKSSVGLGTKVGIANVVSSLCTQCGLETMQPYAGKPSHITYVSDTRGFMEIIKFLFLVS